MKFDESWFGEPSNAIDVLDEAVQKLRADHSDNEAAHGSEDAIHVAALGIIASGCPDPAAVAKKALETINIDFERWYA